MIELVLYSDVNCTLQIRISKTIVHKHYLVCKSLA